MRSAPPTAAGYARIDLHEPGKVLAVERMGDEGDTYGPYTVQSYRELHLVGESVAYYPNLTTAAATHIRHRGGRRTTTSTTRFLTFAELSGTNMRASRAGRSRLRSSKTPPFMPSPHRVQPKSREARQKACLPS